VKLQKADPPGAVIDAFRDVQAARADQERMRNEAQAYANDVVPRARGQAEQIRLEAEGYREQTVAEAQGEVSRYLAIMKQYQNAKDVTRKRLYLETMERVLQGMNKVIIDKGAGGPGVVPYLPLKELQAAGKSTGNAGSSGAGSGSMSSGQSSSGQQSATGQGGAK
jgi:membrane protease subunit HflK